MALQTCDKHVTSDGEVAIIVYESYRRSYCVARCPVCELEEEITRLKEKLANMQANYPIEAYGP
jgi:hypothetical protein